MRAGSEWRCRKRDFRFLPPSFSRSSSSDVICGFGAAAETTKTRKERKFPQRSHLLSIFGRRGDSGKPVPAFFGGFTISHDFNDTFFPPDVRQQLHAFQCAPQHHFLFQNWGFSFRFYSILGPFFPFYSPVSIIKKPGAENP